MTVDAERLAEWKRLTEAATPGPWTWDDDDWGELVLLGEKDATIIRRNDDGELVSDHDDRNFIAVARTAMSALLDAVAALTADLAAARRERDALAAALERLEWSVPLAYSDAYACPACGHRRERGHKGEEFGRRRCWLDAALTEWRAQRPKEGA